MLKRIALLISLFFYLLAASGATVHFHFCQGKPQQISLNSTHDSHCPLCAKSAKKYTHCHEESSCKDVLLELKKVDVSYVSSKTTWKDDFTPMVILLPWLAELYIFPNQATAPYNRYDPVPLQYNNAIFLWHRNFRI